MTRRTVVWVTAAEAELAEIFQAVGFFRMESCPTQAVLPLVGLAAEKVTRDRYLVGIRVALWRYFCIPRDRHRAE